MPLAAPGALLPTPIRTLAVLILLSCSAGMAGQDAVHWSGLMRNPEVPIDSVRQAFEVWAEQGNVERGKGMKPFQRWLAFMAPRVDADGLRPTNGRTLRALEEARLDALSESAARTLNDPEWQYEGPIGPTGLGGSGRLNRVVPRPGVPDEWWACAPAGGLWRTQDGGGSWAAMGNGQLTSIGVTDLAFHPTDPDRLWIATGDGDFGDTRSIGVWTSGDGGESWSATALDWAPYMGRTQTRMLVHPDQPDTLWTASSLGVYRSLNGGVSWARTLTGDIASLEVDPSDPDHLLAGSFGNLIAESHDAGGSWSTQYLDGNTYGLSRIALAFSPSDPTVVYAMAGKVSNQGFAGIWRSVDGGDTWNAQALDGAAPNLLGWTVDGADAGGQAWYDLCLAVDPTDSDKLYAGGVNLWASSDAGVTWSCAGHWYAGGERPYLHADQHGMAFLDDGRLVIGNDGGAFTYDPATDEAEDHSAGLAIAQAYRIDLDPLAMDRFIAGTQDNGTFLKHDGQWEHVLGGDGFACAFHGEVEDVVYASLYYGQVFRSEDGGNAFVEIAGNAGSGVDSQGAWLTPWAVSRFNPDWVYVAKDRVYRSTNRGEDWTALGDIPGGEATALGLCPSDVSRIYVAKEFRLYRSTNGQTFDLLDTPNGFSWIQDIEVDVADADHLWITLSNYNNEVKVLESTDGGDTWTNLSDGLPEAPVNCIAPDVAGSGLHYVGTDVGVYRLDPAAGSEWERLSEGLPNVVVSDLVVHAPSGRLAAATYGRGIYTLELPDPPTVDAALGRIFSPRGSTCDAESHPVLPVINLGTQPIQQLQIQYGHFGGASADTVWNGWIEPGDSLHLQLAPLPTPAGWSQFTAILTGVNGAVDERTANNTRSVEVHRMDNGTPLILAFESDCFASQHGWVLRDALGRVLHRSGWVAPQTLTVDTLCVPNACLTLEIHRDQLSGYEPLMADCATPLAFHLSVPGADAPFLVSPEAGVVGTYTLCMEDLASGGCQDPYASNYDANALFDDGTCEPTCYPLTISMEPGCNAPEVSWSLSPDGLAISAGAIGPGPQSWTLCLDEGCRDFQIQDANADGWAECPDGPTSWTLLIGSDTLLHEVNPQFSSVLTEEICLPPVSHPGCREPQACNFDPAADGPGFCDYSCFGCTDPDACNYDMDATLDDGTCLQATGCTHPAACNFDLFALCDDGTCFFAEEGLDCAGDCLSGDADGDGICDGDEFAGCTHPDACNFTAGATEDDGSCFFPILAWPDADGDGYGDADVGTAQPFCGVPPPGWVTNTGDCNDGSASYYPGAPVAPLGGDVNCDGFVSGSELAPCASDLNGDGLTAIEDLLGLLSEFGCTVDCSQDVDGNGAVTSADLLILLAGFGTVCTP